MPESTALNAEISKDLKKALDRTCIDREMTLKAAISQAIERWVAEEEKENAMAKSPTSFHLDHALLKRLRVACAERGVKQTDAVAVAIEHWLEPGKSLSPQEPLVQKSLDLDLGVGKAHNQEIDRVLERMGLVRDAIRGLEEAIGGLGGPKRGERAEDSRGESAGAGTQAEGDFRQAQDWLRDTEELAEEATASRKTQKVSKKRPA